jgi:tetratricopeptide (TPR) repeat protein
MRPCDGGLATNTLTIVANLASLYQAQGRYGEAERLLKRVLEAEERVFGKEHPSTLISVNNLAELYRIQGRYGEAEPLFKRALEAKERVLGKEHPSTLTSVNNLEINVIAKGLADCGG